MKVPKKALVVGGNSGIGLAIAIELLKRNYDFVHIVGKSELRSSWLPEDFRDVFSAKTDFESLNLTNCDYSFFNTMSDIDTLVITTGFGRVAPFENLTEAEINNLVKVNELAVIQIIKKFYDKIHSNSKFCCAVMGSIAGHVASPLFSVYGATKAGVCSFIENINAELGAEGCINRILDVSPGSLKGTSFSGEKTVLSNIQPIAASIVDHMIKGDTIYIPQYDEVYKSVIERYKSDQDAFYLESYHYKIDNGKISTKPQVMIGYLSGTFDLFHIGHLNLLRRAKEQCDYLIVGVHRSGAWKGKETFIPFEERKAIVGSVRYADEVIESFPEDSDAWLSLHYSKLFVGSDYKGSARFKRYEEYFKDKGVEIIYFPYTDGTSSTQLREVLLKSIKKQNV